MKVNWNINQYGMSVQAMGASHRRLASACIRADAFRPYDVDEDLQLGTNLDRSASFHGYVITSFIKCKMNFLVSYTRVCETSAGYLRWIYPSLGI